MDKINNSIPPVTDNEVKWEQDLDFSVNTEQTLLFDFCRLLSGSILNNEITVNRGSDGNLYFNVYIGGMANYTGKEIRTAFLTDDECLNELLAVTKRYGIEQWCNKMRDPSMGSMMGGMTVVKYLDENGKLIRVTTKCMPGEGIAAFQEIESILQKHLKRAKRVL